MLKMLKIYPFEFPGGGDYPSPKKHLLFIQLYNRTFIFIFVTISTSQKLVNFDGWSQGKENEQQRIPVAIFPISLPKSPSKKQTCFFSSSLTLFQTTQWHHLAGSQLHSPTPSNFLCLVLTQSTRS